MAVVDSIYRENSLIVDERYMRCPRCKEVQDILRYKPMEVIEEFRLETVPLYKCPKCRFIFAPSNNALTEIFGTGELKSD
jgi:uncharacterized protein with PIN domain